MFTLENFGITRGFVAGTVVGSAVGFCIFCAAAIVLWCLFCIGLARIAKTKGEEKEWYAYLPLLRFYTLGKMVPGSESTKKVFACLLPSLALARFVLKVASLAALVNAFFGLIFAAENINGGAVEVLSFVKFPLVYCAALLIITLIVSLAFKIISAVCLYGAFSGLDTARAIVFAVASFICCPLGAIFLYIASRETDKDNEKAE